LHNFLRGQRWLDPWSPEEEQAAQQRLTAETVALASKRKQEAAVARHQEKRERLRPIFEAFIAKFGEEARQHEGAEPFISGKWMFLHDKYGGPTAADVPDGNTLSINDFMTAYQKRRDDAAYREACAARDSLTSTQKSKSLNTSAMPQHGGFQERLSPLCAAA
jgi:hypothetical protein